MLSPFLTHMPMSLLSPLEPGAYSDENRMNRYLILLLIVGCSLLRAGPSAAAVTPPGIVVSGNHLTTDSGLPLRVQGVNRSGTEYACAQGWGIFDGPDDSASIAAIAAWGVNAVRVPLNEDCWLGINGVNPQYGGAGYQSAIHDYVSRLLGAGLDVILDLHWGAPGDQLALGQEQAPDADHSPAFWTSVAAAFKGTAGIAYDLFNEPHDVSWSCWRNGCQTPAGWEAAGMQQLVNAVRSTGAKQPVIAEGLNWGGDLSGWLANAPSDPDHQLVAGWHVYNFSGCDTGSCWDSTIAPVATQAPVLATEIGENDCAGTFLDSLLPWADAHSIGYLAWAWNTSSCTGGPALISDYNGTPTPFGAAYKSYVAADTTSMPAPITCLPGSTPIPPTAPTTSKPTAPPSSGATVAAAASKTTVRRRKRATGQCTSPRTAPRKRRTTRKTSISRRSKARARCRSRVRRTRSIRPNDCDAG